MTWRGLTTKAERLKFAQFFEETSREDWRKIWKKKTHQFLSHQFESFVKCALEWHEARECMISLCPESRQKLGRTNEVDAAVKKAMEDERNAVGTTPTTTKPIARTTQTKGAKPKALCSTQDPLSVTPIQSREKFLLLTPSERWSAVTEMTNKLDEAEKKLKVYEFEIMREELLLRWGELLVWIQMADREMGDFVRTFTETNVNRDANERGAKYREFANLSHSPGHIYSIIRSIVDFVKGYGKDGLDFYTKSKTKMLAFENDHLRLLLEQKREWKEFFDLFLQDDPTFLTCDLAKILAEAEENPKLFLKRLRSELDSWDPGCLSKCMGDFSFDLRCMAGDCVYLEKRFLEKAATQRQKMGETLLECLEDNQYLVWLRSEIKNELMEEITAVEEEERYMSFEDRRSSKKEVEAIKARLDALLDRLHRTWKAASDQLSTMSKARCTLRQNGTPDENVENETAIGAILDNFDESMAQIKRSCLDSFADCRRRLPGVAKRRHYLETPDGEFEIRRPFERILPWSQKLDGLRSLLEVERKHRLRRGHGDAKLNDNKKMVHGICCTATAKAKRWWKEVMGRKKSKGRKKSNGRKKIKGKKKAHGKNKGKIERKKDVGWDTEEDSGWTTDNEEGEEEEKIQVCGGKEEENEEKQVCDDKEEEEEEKQVCDGKKEKEDKTQVNDEEEEKVEEKPVYGGDVEKEAEKQVYDGNKEEEGKLVYEVKKKEIEETGEDSRQGKGDEAEATPQTNGQKGISLGAEEGGVVAASAAKETAKKKKKQKKKKKGSVEGVMEEERNNEDDSRDSEAEGHPIDKDGVDVEGGATNADDKKKKKEKEQKAESEDGYLEREEQANPDDRYDDDATRSQKAARLRTCCSSTCGIKESVPKSFQGCSRCRKDGLWPRSFYCSRECQLEDWKKRHHQFHKDEKKRRKPRGEGEERKRREREVVKYGSEEVADSMFTVD